MLSVDIRISTHSQKEQSRDKPVITEFSWIVSESLMEIPEKLKLIVTRFDVVCIWTVFFCVLCVCYLFQQVGKLK